MRLQILRAMALSLGCLQRVVLPLIAVLSKKVTWLHTEPGLGSVPSPSSHCCVGHSFGGRCFSYGATTIFSACTVYSFGGGVGIVVLADSRRQVLPGRPVPSPFQVSEVFQTSKLDCGSRRGYLTWYFTSAFPKGDLVKNSAKSVYKQKSLIFDPFRIVETPDLSDAPSKWSKPKINT